MPYDPNMMMQLGQYGMGMLGPQGGAVTSGAPTDEQMMQMAMQRRQPFQFKPPTAKPANPTNPPTAAASDQSGQSANSPGQPANSLTPSLLQLLMLGGKPTYSGSGAAPSGSYGAIPGGGAGGMNMGANPWAWLGNYFGGGGGTPGAT